MTKPKKSEMKAEPVIDGIAEEQRKSAWPQRWTIPVCSGCGMGGEYDCVCPPGADAWDVDTEVVPVEDATEKLQRSRRHATEMAQAGKREQNRRIECEALLERIEKVVHGAEWSASEARQEIQTILRGRP